MEPHLKVVEQLSRAHGVVAIVLGGSRATGKARADSDWDLGLYYRGALNLAPLEQLGTAHAPGSWGRIMNGGAWVRVDGVVCQQWIDAYAASR